MSAAVYTKDHMRRPVQHGSLWFFRDTQADIPLGWCEVCGSEVFEAGQPRCLFCRGRKGEV